MNIYTTEAQKAGDAALATAIGSPTRAAYLAEGSSFAAIGDAIDRAELLVIERAQGMAQASALYDLIPAESALNLAELSEDAQSAIRAIAQADAEELPAIGVVLFPHPVTNVGAGHDAQRVAAAAIVLGLDEVEEGALAAWYGVVSEERAALRLKAEEAPTVVGEELTDQGTEGADAFAGDFFADAAHDAPANPNGGKKAGESKKKKGGKKS